MNIISVLLIAGLVYVSMQQKNVTHRNAMLVVTGLLVFCMISKEGFTLPMTTTTESCTPPTCDLAPGTDCSIAQPGCTYVAGGSAVDTSDLRSASAIYRLGSSATWTSIGTVVEDHEVGSELAITCKIATPQVTWASGQDGTVKYNTTDTTTVTGDLTSVNIGSIFKCSPTDTGRCATVTCHATSNCKVAGTCDTSTGTCSDEDNAPDNQPCDLVSGSDANDGICTGGVCGSSTDTGPCAAGQTCTDWLAFGHGAECQDAADYIRWSTKCETPWTW